MNEFVYLAVAGSLLVGVGSIFWLRQAGVLARDLIRELKDSKEVTPTFDSANMEADIAGLRRRMEEIEQASLRYYKMGAQRVRRAAEVMEGMEEELDEEMLAQGAEELAQFVHPQSVEGGTINGEHPFIPASRLRR